MTTTGRASAPGAPRTPYGAGGEHAQGSAIDATLSVLASRKGILSLASGSPAADAIPRDEIAAAVASCLADPRVLDYAPTEGLPALRAALLQRLERMGHGVEPDRVLITTGGMQGIDLVCRLFLDRGDLVLAESPSYANGLATLHNSGAKIVQIPLDDDGMDLDAAQAAVTAEGRAPKLIYAIPTFQNPSGLTYTTDRRRGLVEFAREQGALVIEDDPYGELTYEGEVPPRLLDLDPDGDTVITVNTFSKIVAPGLRVGWVIAPPDTVRRMTAVRQGMDTCTNTLGQAVIARLIANGDIERHIAKLRRMYPRRRDVMLEALGMHLRDSRIRWTRPSGGVFIWLDLPGIDGGDVLLRGLDHGVAIVPGAAFDPIRGRHAVRLCFTALDEAGIAEAVARLARAIAAAA